MSDKTDEQDAFINLAEMDDEGDDDDQIMGEVPADSTVPFFSNPLLQSTPVKTRPDLFSPVKSGANSSISNHLSHSEGDLSRSFGLLDVSSDDRSPQKKRARQSTEMDVATLDRLQTPVYCQYRLSNEEILALLTDIDSIDQSKVCNRIPVGPPGTGQWTFLVNLESVEVCDLAFDGMGSWGKPGGRTLYYRSEGDKFKRVATDKMPEGNWDFRIKCNRYNHPGAKNGKFGKMIFVTEKQDKSLNCQFAVICYDASIGPSEVKIVAHKTAKDQEKPMPRTKRSVFQKQRQLLPSHTPHQVNRVILQESGGVSSIYSPVDVPANQRQIRNQSARNVPNSKRITRAGRPAMNKYDELEKMMSHQGSFVRAVEYVPATDESPMCIRVFVGDQHGLEVAKKFSLTTTTPTQLHRSMEIDMSYDGVNGFYITPVSIRDPRFFNTETAKPPIVVVGCGLTTGRTTADYTFLARNLVEKMGLKPSDRIKTWVTDGEKALIQGFQSVPQFQPPFSLNLRCELHMKSNVDAKLKSCNKHIKRQIIDTIFGTEKNIEGKRVREQGLVDCMSEVEFDARLAAKRTEWDRMVPAFYNWFQRNTGAVIKKSYLLVHRQKANNPYRLTTNTCEKLNSLIKSQFCHIRLPIHEAIRELEKYVDGEFDRMKEAVFQRGNFRLEGSMAEKYELSDLQFTLMTEKEKDEIYDKLGLLQGPQVNPNKTLSIDIESDAQIIEIPAKELRRLQYAAHDLLEVGTEAFSQCPTDRSVTSVWQGVKQFEVRCHDEDTFECSWSCSDWKGFRFICPHTLAVAEFSGNLFGHIRDVKVKLAAEDTNKTISAATNDPDAGHKPGTRRRGAMESAGTKKNDNVQLVIQRRTVPPVPVSDRLQQPIPRPTLEELNELQVPKTFYQQPWHNDREFILVLYSDYKRRYKDTKAQCKSCGNALSTRDIAPNNVVFVHYERYWVPPIRGAQGYHTVSNVRPSIIHFAYHCLKKRYYYISYDLLRMDPLLTLEPAHEQLMKEQFGVSMFEPATTDWRENPFR